MGKFYLPPLNSLRAFEAAARHQSIKEACRELHVTHTAVSRQIQKLEQQVGRPLFERTHRKITLTDDGAILLNAVTLGFSHIQRAFLQLSRGPSPDSLVISVDSDFAGLWLVPRLADFYGNVPNLLVEIRAENTQPVQYDPRINCAIHYAPAGLELKDREMLFRSRLFPVCARDFPPVRSAENLRNHVLVHDRSIREWEDYLRDCEVPIDFNVRSGLIFSETALCLDAAVRGQGVALGDDFLAATYLQERRLVKPFGSAVPSKNAYYFIVPEGAPEHPAVQTFRMWLFHNIEQHRANFLIG
jgi:LysR family transcriptional regulator, glycine cleavage system transcriptional activator